MKINPTQPIYHPPPRQHIPERIKMPETQPIDIDQKAVIDTRITKINWAELRARIAIMDFNK